MAIRQGNRQSRTEGAGAQNAHSHDTSFDFLIARPLLRKFVLRPNIVAVPAQSYGGRLPNILLTRPHAQARHFADALIAQGVQPDQITIDPIMKIAPVETACDISACTGLIITSANALSYLPVALRGSRLPCYCVGDSTSQAARALGLNAYHLADTARDLCEALPTVCQEGPLLHLRGTHTTLNMAEHFRSTPLPVENVVVYEQIALPLQAETHESLRRSSPVILPIFSARSAKLLGKLALDWRPHWAVALSPTIAALCQEAGFGQITTAAQPNRQAMVAVITPLMDVKSG